MSALPYRLRSVKVRSQHRAVSGLLQGLSRVVYRLPLLRAEGFGVHVVRDIPYRKTGLAAHTLDVYRPAGPTPTEGYPVVFYVHGGGFAMLSKDTHQVMAMAFARQGYVVVNVNYRLGYRNPFPLPLEDVSEALAFAVRTAHVHGGDASRLVLAGESAGGNLVTALAVGLSSERSEAVVRPLRQLRQVGFRPVAVVPVYGMLDLTDLPRLGRRKRLPPGVWDQIFHAAESYLGGDWSPARASAAPLASPLRIIEDAAARGARLELPPFFVPCGTRDPLLTDSQRLTAALSKLSIPVTELIHEGEIHGYNALIWRPAAKDMWRRVHAFLRPLVASAAPADADPIDAKTTDALSLPSRFR
jgi:acetyl esterase